jgi:hypothetical protein
VEFYRFGSAVHRNKDGRLTFLDPLQKFRMFSVTLVQIWKRFAEFEKQLKPV